MPCEKRVPRVIAIWLALTFERVAYAFLVEACCEKYVPRNLPVAFVICIRANRCLLGLSKCFRAFVGLLSPSGGDSFWGAGAQCTSWRVSCVRFVRVGRIPACAANSTGAFLHVPRVNALRLSSTRLRVAYASLVVKVLAKSPVPRFVAVRLALTCLRVACALLVEAPCENLCPSVGSRPVGFDLPTS